MIPCLHFGLRLASGRFPIEPKLASWVESGYKSPESPGPRQRGRRRDGLSRRRRGRFRSTAPYPAATNSRGVSKPRARRDNGLTLGYGSWGRARTGSWLCTNRRAPTNSWSPVGRPLQEAYPRGETVGFLRSPFRSLRGEVVPLGRWCTIRDGGIRSPRT